MSGPLGGPRVLAIEHDAECPPAWFGTWLEEEGCEVEVCRPYAGDDLPDLPEAAAYDALVILGGPMGADDDAQHAWIGAVKELVRSVRADRLPTLGICLGHQLIASALGGTVVRNPLGQQVGLLGLGWTDAAAGDLLLGPLATPRRGVQWNDDVVSALPADAVLLAETDRGEVQAARYGARMWGVQLHPEVDDETLRPWAEEDRGSHETRGIDTDGLLRDVRAARAELDNAWRPLAVGFAALARERQQHPETTEIAAR